MSDAARFWAKVGKTDTCWLWTASRDLNGYGRFRGPGGQAGRMLKAHRWAYESLIGPVPEGLDLDHLCRVRHCVRPSHLEPVTRLVNLLRGKTLIADQVARTECPRGHSYDGVNTGRSKTGRRVCRACNAANCAAWRAKRAAA